MNTVPNFFEFATLVNDRFDAAQESGNTLFLTESEVDLKQVYLDAFERAYGPIVRQYNNCNCCLAFLNQVGSVAFVGESGRLISALWNEEEVDEHYKPIVQALREAVENSTIAKPFISTKVEYGAILNGGHNHFFLTAVRKWNHGSVTASSEIGRLLEDRRILLSTFDVYKEADVDKAIELLAYGKLARNAALVKMATWLKGVFQIKNTYKGQERTNLLWHVATTAPHGYTHYHNTLFGLILDDIREGKSFDDIRRRHGALARPEVYMRPTGAPSQGLIKRAEEVFRGLDLAESALRRYATVDDVVRYNEPVWSKAEPEPTSGATGVFAHLLPNAKKEKHPETINMGNVSWNYFQQSVLPTAKELAIHTPRKAGFLAFITAENENAKPIMKWDREEKRNPISWYTLHGGAYATDFDLVPGAYTAVSHIINHPEHDGYMLLLEGAKHISEKGLGLFPECMRTELHEVRKVIEAFSNEGSLGVPEGTLAGGLYIADGITGLQLRIKNDKGAQVVYTIASWK